MCSETSDETAHQYFEHFANQRANTYRFRATHLYPASIPQRSGQEPRTIAVLLYPSVWRMYKQALPPRNTRPSGTITCTACWHASYSAGVMGGDGASWNGRVSNRQPLSRRLTQATQQRQNVQSLSQSTIADLAIVICTPPLTASRRASLTHATRLAPWRQQRHRPSSRPTLAANVREQARV